MRRKPTVLYGASDVAALFGVTKCCASNWARRHPDTPVPDFVTVSGAKFWLSLDGWILWHAERQRAEAKAGKQLKGHPPEGVIGA